MPFPRFMAKLVLGISYPNTLYLCQVLPKYLKVFLELQTSRVDASRVDANVDGGKFGRTHGWKTGSSYHTMPEAGLT